MEATIDNYVFKLDSDNPRKILIFERDEMDEPYSFVNLTTEPRDEKEFHFEISDWYMNANR
tara:strand:- start:2105 stop:2287 length:183 start_codon:yes stop_codon:yes gene_type:complete